MPIKIGKRTFSTFEGAVRFIAKLKAWSLKRARAYVAEIDRKQNPEKHKRKRKK